MVHCISLSDSGTFFFCIFEHKASADPSKHLKEMPHLLGFGIMINFDVLTDLEIIDKRTKIYALVA